MSYNKLIPVKETDQLLNEILDQYGYDFTQYAKASIYRRIQSFAFKKKIPDITTLRNRLINDRALFASFVEEVTVNVTEMFRDPTFYKALREKVLPLLATYPLIRIWHAGCSTGEEVFSLAILLKEAGLLQKSLLYATDINQSVVDRARRGLFHTNTMQQAAKNYIDAGGLYSLSNYYTANYQLAKFDTALSERMVFATHNLVSDTSFNEFQLILCRNVLIYFDRDLQSKVFELFDKSIDQLGFLALGNKESIKFSTIAPHYYPFDIKEKIWRRIR